MKKPKLLQDKETGLIHVRLELSPEQRRERRADNKAAKLSRAKNRRRRKHGRQ